MSKRLFYGELCNGKRPQYRPKKRYKDCIKANLKAAKLNVEDWEVDAIHQSEWQTSLYKGCQLFEEERLKKS